MRYMLKRELADLAGVSFSTFKRWLSQHRDELADYGVSVNARLIPPAAVKYICDQYGIDV